MRRLAVGGYVGEGREFDYVIVGAGSAGCAVAARLSEDQNVRVLLLDQGPVNSSWTVQIPGGLRENFKPGGRYMRWYPTVPQKGLNGRVIDHPRGMGIGGTSLVNGMVFLRGSPFDYDRWQDEGATGWSYADVLPYFKRMETFAGGADAYRGGAGPVQVRRQQDLHILNQAFLNAGQQAGYAHTDDVNGYQQEGFCRFDMNVDKGYRSSASRAFIQQGPPKPNLDVRSGTTVHRVVIENGVARGVVFQDSAGVHDVSAAREVILSAGAVGSPQLLMLSGVGPADELRSAGISPVHDLPGVGRNLHDHLEIDLQWECTQPITVNGLLKPHKMALIGLEWLLFKQGMAAVNQCHVGAFVRSGSEPVHPNIQFHFFPVCFNGWVPRKDMHGFRVGAGPMRQSSRGTLKLRSANPSDLPIVDPNYVSTDKDLRELVESCEILLDVVSQKAFDKYRGKPLEPKIMPKTKAEMTELARNMAGSGFHLCGTCKMGAESDASAVVDPNLKVRGVRGLRVVDASVMPSIVSSNLNAPTMMIGERGADLIRGKVVPRDTTPYHHPQGAPH